MPKASRGASRCFCFTAWTLEEPKWDVARMRFLIYQREVCPTTHKEHWQGYVSFLLQVDVKSVASALGLPKSTHIEARRGSVAQALEYCQKEKSAVGSTKRFGTPPEDNQGKRTDLEDVAVRLKSGESMRTVAFAYPSQFMRYSRGFYELQKLVRAPFRDDVRTYYFWGPPGVGKSRHVWSFLRPAYEKDEVYVAKDHGQGWFDGYCGERVIYFEDFGGSFPLKDLLQLCDRYPTSQWIKGSSVPVRATVFVFSANAPPSAYYCGNEAWIRRFVDFGNHVYEVSLEGGLGGGVSLPPIEL